MAKMKQLKRSLIASCLALTVSASALVGTTFAWFTDSVSSANNIIKSGNLDVALEYWDGDSWEDVNEASTIFDANALWEPGYTATAYFKITNEGSLALKYQFGVNVVSETAGVNVAGQEFKLSDYIYFDMFEGVNGQTNAFANRDAAMANTTETTLISAGYTQASSLAAESDPVYLAMVVYMPETVGNEANHNGVKVPQINLGVNVTATQYAAEKDSFDETYDEVTPWLGGMSTDWYTEAGAGATAYTLSTSEDLAGLAAIVNGPQASTRQRLDINTIQDDFKGKTVTLDGDLDLQNVAWAAIGTNEHPFLGNFDGQGHTISNLYVENEGWAGIFGHVGLGVGSTIKNVNVENATIKSNRMAGVIVGQIYGNVENCHVTNANITVVPNAVADGYDNGDKVGGIVGWLGDNGNNRVLKDCTAKNVNITAYRDMGGIVGYAASSTTIENCQVDTIFMMVDQATNYYGDKDYNAGAIFGRKGGEIVEINNSSANVATEKKVTTRNYDDFLYFSGESTNYVLTGDVVASDRIFCRPGTTNSIDLANHTITAENVNQYLFIAQQGGKLTFNGEGTVNCGKGFFANKDNVEIEVNGGTYNSTVSGTLDGTKHASLAQNDAKIVINGGTFTTNVEGSALFHVTSNSRLEIKGGFFENTADAGVSDLLSIGNNKYNTNRIVITGGTFVNYNPLNDQMCYTGAWPEAGEAAFGGPWILIPGGYMVVAETQANGDIWYTVVKA